MNAAMNKVKFGDPLRIPASTFNAFIDAAEDLKRRQRDQGQSSGKSGARPGTILVKNNSGADRARFDVLGVDGPLFDPADNEDAFLEQVVFGGSTPDAESHTGKFVVLAEPVQDGWLGRAWVAGTFPAWVDIVAQGDQFCDIADGETLYLASGSSGAAQILWSQGGTGQQWAIVRIGGGVAGIMFGKPTSAYTNGSTITLDPCDAGGADNGQANVTVQAGWTLPANTNIPTTAIIPFMRAASGSYYAIGQMREVVTNIQYDTTAHKLQKKVRADFGTFSTTESSAWVDITTSVPCTT